ncbi:hypothetical protein SAMN05216196_101550 [Lutimaribacter pacificus]|uniref:Uncharacterized protein n=1 Tax=Lutimaribacter pacificus TaxID=391948 RepID=A0A1H0BFM9_9RHOB|nr:hypothetical protein SAMN05216196_101550 [Lutimaribacter pacificus]SHJ56918.1 hypothetical protein SAMN05444142_101667 [Lutimaribacter pacificus]
MRRGGAIASRPGIAARCLRLVLGPGLIALILAAPQAARAETAAECAAFWRAVAAEQRAMPGFDVPPDDAAALAAEFAALAGTVARDRVGGYRLLYRGLVDGDRQSTDLFSRIAERCDALLAPGR